MLTRGASPRSRATAAPSSVADITSTRSAGDSAARPSRHSASPRSACRLRSWNSSKMTAATPSSAGSSCSSRVSTPSVTTSMRVARDTRVSSRMRYPMVPPGLSPRVCAMRAATARAATRRGSSSSRRFPCAQGSSSNASGTTLLLPAPGGASSTAEACVFRAASSAGSAASIGSPDLTRCARAHPAPGTASVRGARRTRCTSDRYCAPPR